jgi:hypothetical protein
VVGRAAFAFERDFLAAIDLFLVFGCSDRFVSVAAPFAASLTRRTRPVKIDTSFEKAANRRVQDDIAAQSRLRGRYREARRFRKKSRRRLETNGRS